MDLSQRSQRTNTNNSGNNNVPNPRKKNRGPFYIISKNFLNLLPGIEIGDIKYRVTVYQFPEVVIISRLLCPKESNNMLAYEAWRKDVKIYFNQKSSALEI